MRQAEGASEASTRAKRAAHDPKCIRLGVNTSEGPKCIQPGMYDCLEYNGTYRRTKRVDNGVLDTLKRDLWTNRLEGWRKNIHPWADITRSTCNAGLCTAEADICKQPMEGGGDEFQAEAEFCKKPVEWKDKNKIPETKASSIAFILKER